MGSANRYAEGSKGQKAERRVGYSILVRGLVGIASLCISASAVSESLSGWIVRISDGDTLTLLDDEKVQHRIRNAGIDAPERRQAFGHRARQNLARMTFQKEVVVEWHKRDRYGRLIGKVLVGGMDVGLLQVQAGMAWHYKAYQSEQSAVDRELYSQAEGRARREKRGLWADKEPMPPWDFRKAGRRSAK